MKVIVFQGQSQYDVLRTYSAIYTQKMQEYGIEAITCDMNLVDESMYLNIVEKFKPDFTIGFNPVCFVYENDMLHFNKTQIPHLVWLGDNPNYHVFNRALKNPHDPLVYSLITEKFFEYSFKKMGVNRYAIKKCSPAEQKYQISYKNKIYPTVFFGSYIDPDKILLQFKQNCNLDQIKHLVLDFCTIIKEIVVQGKTILNEPIEVLFSNYLKNKYHLENEQIKILTQRIFYYIDHYYRNIVREYVLTSFAEENLEMFVFGKEDTQRLLNKYSNVKVFNSINYNEYISVLAHSKVAINITPMFTSFHERISTTLINSTLLCSNVMEGLMTSHPEILESSIFYNLDNLKETVQVIKAIINNEEDYNTLIDTGLNLALQNFTFENDIKEIVSIYKEKF